MTASKGQETLNNIQQNIVPLQWLRQQAKIEVEYRKQTAPKKKKPLVLTLQMG